VNKHFLSLAIILLSLSIVFLGFQFSKKLDHPENMQKESGTEMAKGLMTLGETAKYLSMTEDQFKRVIIQQDAIRTQLTSYDTYRFIPYIKVKDEKFFSKYQVDEWIKHTFWEEIE
jgi:hypothetical protein